MVTLRGKQVTPSWHWGTYLEQLQHNLTQETWAESRPETFDRGTPQHTLTWIAHQVTAVTHWKAVYLIMLKETNSFGPPSVFQSWPNTLFRMRHIGKWQVTYQIFSYCPGSSLSFSTPVLCVFAPCFLRALLWALTPEPALGFLVFATIWISPCISELVSCLSFCHSQKLLLAPLWS